MWYQWGQCCYEENLIEFNVAPLDISECFCYNESYTTEDNAIDLDFSAFIDTM